MTAKGTLVNLQWKIILKKEGARIGIYCMCNIRTDPNPNLFPFGFVQGSWNCDDRMKSVVWGKRECSHMRKIQGCV